MAEIPMAGSSQAALVRRVPPLIPGAARSGPLILAAGFASLFVAWLLLTEAMGPNLLPGPAAVGRVLWSEIRSGALAYHLGATMARVLVSAALAIAVGSVFGIWMGLSRRADVFLGPWLVAGLAVPRLLIIAAAYLLLGLNEWALVLATVLATAPSVLAAMREAIRSVDWKLVDMARAFEVPGLWRWRLVVGPQLLPYLAGTARAAVSLSFKVAVFAELLGRPSGVGYQIHFYFQMFNMGRILAYGVATVAVAAALELAMRALERRVWRWRPAPGV